MGGICSSSSNKIHADDSSREQRRQRHGSISNKSISNNSLLKNQLSRSNSHNPGNNNSIQLLRNQSSRRSSKGTHWAVLLDTTEARTKFYNDGTLPLTSSSSHLELRELLENPFAQSALMKYATHIGTVRFLSCWIDIQEFKSIPASGFRRSKALHIYYKYIKVGSPLEIEGLEDDDRKGYKHRLIESKNEESLLSTKFFNVIQRKCFTEVHNIIFRPFYKKPEYNAMIEQIQSSYNKVTVVRPLHNYYSITIPTPTSGIHFTLSTVIPDHNPISLLISIHPQSPLNYLLPLIFSWILL